MIVETKNAIIESVRLEKVEGFLDAWLMLNYGTSACQGFGGYALYLPKDYRHHNISGVAGHFIWRVMEVADVEDWSKLVGRSIRVRGTRNKIEAIGHITKDDWFCPAKDFATAKEDV